MDQLAQLARILEQGGPWALLALALLAIGYLYRAKEKRNEAHRAEMVAFVNRSRDEHEAKNAKIMEMNEALTAAITKNTEALARLEKSR